MRTFLAEALRILVVTFLTYLFAVWLCGCAQVRAILARPAVAAGEEVAATDRRDPPPATSECGRWPLMLDRPLRFNRPRYDGPVRCLAGPDGFDVFFCP